MRAQKMLAALAIVVGTAAPIALTGCSSSEPKASAAQAASAEAEHVSVKQFAAALDAPGTKIIDVRTSKEFGLGHIPKATNIDVTAADFDEQIGKLDKGAHYAIYCWSSDRSRDAVIKMKEAGFTQLVALDGGINAWMSEGKPVGR